MNESNERIEFSENYLNMRSTIDYVNGIIEKIKENIFNYLNNKHENKLDPSIDLISQDRYDVQQQQILYDLFKRTVYYFNNIQFDLNDQFWGKAKGLMTVDLTKYDTFEKAKIYKNILHLILQYQQRIIENQKKLQKQKEEAERIKKIEKEKQRREKEKSEQQKKEEQKKIQEQQQLIETFDKMTEIIAKKFSEQLSVANKVKKKNQYAISKLRRLEKNRQQKKKEKFSSYNPNIKRPRKPKRPKSY